MEDPNFRFYMERKLTRGSNEPNLHILPPEWSNCLEPGQTNAAIMTVSTPSSLDEHDSQNCIQCVTADHNDGDGAAALVDSHQRKRESKVKLRLPETGLVSCASSLNPVRSVGRHMPVWIKNLSCGFVQASSVSAFWAWFKVLEPATHWSKKYFWKLKRFPEWGIDMYY